MAVDRVISVQRRKRWLAARLLLVSLAVVCLGGCGIVGARNPLPAELASQAGIPEIDGVRYWADAVPEAIHAEMAHRFPNLPRLAQASTRIGGRHVVETLAISGGGPNGAFGAGLLAGWTATGRRPDFELVTGVSAGALIAPFAFLGPQYDDVLREIWTKYETRDLVRVAGLPGLLGGDALVDTEPLAELIARYLNRRVLDEIAAEYRRGRLLLVLTTNLDAQRPVVWNMGEIAASPHPRAMALFHKVLLASSAIPGAFPPVRIQVRANGELYDELHVDGGTTRQVFISPVDAPLKAFDPFYDRPPIRRIYVIENGKSAPEYRAVEQKTLPIAGRAISTLLMSQTAGEIYRIYRRTKDAGAEFRFLSIPVDFPWRPVEAFDPIYQQKLFVVGERLGRDADPWLRIPPDLVPTARRPVPAVTKPVPRSSRNDQFGPAQLLDTGN